jgi:diguanylate cyclase (GGDEF)-like protein/PAS domain S-box-containing protein
MLLPSHRRSPRISRDLLVIIFLIGLALMVEWRIALVDLLLAPARRRNAGVTNDALEVAAGLGILLIAFALRQWRLLHREDRDRREAEDALRRSEAQYRALFAAANEPMLIFAPATLVILDANERAADLYGMPRASLIGRSLLGFSTDPDRAVRAIDELLADADATPRRTFSFVQHRPDGTRIDIDAQASVVDYAGRRAILTINRDITAQKQAKELLQRQNGYYTALHETSLELLNQLDLTAVLEAIVARAAALIGTAHGYIELVTDDGTLLLPAVGLGMFRRKVSTGKRRGEGIGGIVWETGRPLVINDYGAWPNRLPDDRRNIYHAVAAVPLIAGDTVVGVLGLGAERGERTFDDADADLLARFAALASIALQNARLHTAAQQELAERRRAEAQVRAGKRRFQAMIERSADAIVLFDATLQRTYVSPSTANVVGYTPEEYRDLRGEDLFHPDDNDRISALFLDVAARPGASATTRARVRHKDGVWRWIVVTYTNLLDEPDVRAIVANYRDITEREVADRQSRRQHAYLEALHDVSLALMQRLDVADVLNTIVRRAGELLETVHGFVALVSEDGALLEFVIGSGVYDAAGTMVVEPGEGIAGVVWQTGEPVTIADYACWPLRRTGPSTDPIHAAVGVPLVSHDRVVGVLSLAYTEIGRTFDATAIETLGRFAQLASIALDNARLHDAAQVEIRERREAEEALRGSEARYRQMFENHQAVQLLIDPATGTIVDANPAACTFYGYAREELRGKPIGEINSCTAPELAEAIRSASAGEGVTFLFQHRLASGDVRDVEVRSGPIESGGRQLLFSIVHDITERKQAEEQLLHHALHDALTRLPNRALFMDRLHHAIARARRHPDDHFAVLFVDFDRFKNVNDSFGHLEGDRLLQEVGRRIGAALDPTATVARLGGDEFAILVEEIAGVADATRAAERVQAAFASPVVIRGQKIFTTASIGIAVSQPTYRRPEEMLRDADTAMYRAKAQGRAQSVVFDRTMHAKVVARLQLENDLRRAIAREEFQVHYQPIVALATGETVGFEALLRWEHPSLGFVTPGEFVPLAEETGLIVALDRWILRRSCEELRRWQTVAPQSSSLAISVNISGKHLVQPDFLEALTAIIAETGIAPSYLTLELTESALVEHAEAASAVLGDLRALGVHVALDDFGMGYSSLNYLRRFPVETLKIDRSFVGARNGMLENAEIVRAIIGLAHTLGIGVVAEGVETETQRAMLAGFDCDAAQGYYFSPPLTGELAQHALARADAPHERHPAR